MQLLGDHVGVSGAVNDVVLETDDLQDADGENGQGHHHLDQGKASLRVMQPTLGRF